MLRLTIKNLLDKKIRFALTTLAVIASVAFVVGVFVLTDSLRASFSGLAGDIAGGSDLTVRVVQEIGQEFDRPPFDEAIAGDIAAVDGVAQIIPGVFSFNDTVIIDGDGEAIRPQGPPALGFSWDPTTFFIANGEVPDAPGEFAADVQTVADNDLVVGQEYVVEGPVRQEAFTLVGTFRFGFVTVTYQGNSQIRRRCIQVKTTIT